MNNLILRDNNSRKYMVMNPQCFYDNLKKYHTTNKIADHSVHKEKGFYFTFTEDLFKKVENFVLNYKI